MYKYNVPYMSGLQIRVCNVKYIFDIFEDNHVLWELQEPSQWDGCFKFPNFKKKSFFKKIILILHS